MPASVAALLALLGLIMVYWAMTGLGLFVATAP